MSLLEEQKLVNDTSRPLIFWVLILALFIRLLHLVFSVDNPMTYNPGSDELFYLEFGKDVSQGQFGLGTPYIFMDPLYGYLIGFFTWIIGQKIFFIYLFQSIVDVFTVLIVYMIGKELWDHRAGLIAAAFYALTSTAIFYTTTILKPTLVANYIAIWVLLSIKVPQSKYMIIWLGFGVFLGLGVALRSNLLLLGLSSFILLPLSYIRYYGNKNILIKMVLLVTGFSLASLMLAARNEHAINHWSILPPNSGIVLHQLYNQDNPQAIQFIPDFVSYGSPSEILTGYINEAEIRVGQKLSLYEVSKFWRNEALSYIESNPEKVLRNILRKTKEFIAFKEIDNSRFLKAETLFSPVLKILPNPFGWLFAFGLPGLLLLLIRNKILSLPIIIAVGVVFVTFVIFIAAARFRAHGLPLFAVGSGVFISAVIDWKNTGKNKIIVLIMFSIILGFLTIWSGKQLHSEAVNPIEFAWGYLKMGQPERAREYALQQMKSNPVDARPYELLGYMALNAKQYEQAISFLSYAVQFLPQHHATQYNLALSLQKTNHLDTALIAVESAIKYALLPDYLFLKGQILEQKGDIEQAIATYEYLIDIAKSTDEWQEYASKSRNRLNILRR